MNTNDQDRCEPCIVDGLCDKANTLINTYWETNPDLFEIVQRKKEQKIKPTDANAAACSTEQITQPSLAKRTVSALCRLIQLKQSPMLQRYYTDALKSKIKASYQKIRANVIKNNGQIEHRTAAHNQKCTFESVEEEQQFRADLLADQVKSWRRLLPSILRKFSRIPDPRNPLLITHKRTVLLMYGLLAFVFKLSSCREMNRELTGPLVFEHLKKIFPDIDTIPHSCTLTRFLEKINPQDLEAANIELIRDMMRNKKFKKLLIQGCLPISIDGAQKLYRDGVLQDPRWCERMVGDKDNQHKQQYLYVVEANITFKNGLNIPIMSEFLYRSNNQLEDPEGKQDSETTAFERLTRRLKQYFPKLKIIIFGDSMFATMPIMELLYRNNWEFIITLPKKKLTSLAKILNTSKGQSTTIPNQSMYRGRWQEFYWVNEVPYGYLDDYRIHLVGCTEYYQDVNKLTGSIEDHYSEHAWISSLSMTQDKLHELINLGARKKELIEDSINTLKNRGYHYKHAYAYHFNAMQGFHYLMRLGSAINALCEFSKIIKKYVRSLGCSATLKMIKETFFSPWLPLIWYERQTKERPQLSLQLE